MAAYVERRLAPAELSSCEAHLVACQRCQEQVAQLVRITEAEEPSERLAAAGVPARKIAWFGWAWAAPVLLVIAVAGLWYKIEIRRFPQHPQEAALKAPPPTPTPAVSSAPQETRAETAPPARREAIKALQSKKEIANLALPPASRAHEMPVAKSRSTIGKLASRGSVRDQLAPAAPVAGTVGAMATPSDRAQLAASASTSADARKRDSESKEARLDTEQEGATAGQPVAPQSSEEKIVGEKSAGREVSEEQATARPNATPPARTNVAKTLVHLAAGKWRVGPHGLIQKADPSGNWVTYPSGVDTDLYDIMFVSSSVGWAVGQAGTVLRTTDGGTSWRKIAIPTTEDLVRVTATSDQAARVVTRSGQTLATIDGGKSWSSSP